MTESHFNSRLDRTANFADGTVAVILFLAVVCFALHKIVAYDVWWQLKTGEWVLDHGFPSTDPFSYATPGRPWIEMRWMYCVAASLIFKGFGLNALIIAKTVLVSLAFGSLWVADRKAPVWGRCLGVACALAVAHLRFTIRPELVTFLLLSVTLLGLHRYKSGGHRKWIYALPLIQILWTNSHTVFILGPVTIWIFALVEVAAGWAPFPAVRASAMSRERLRPLLVVAALSTLACVASPYFIRGALFPLQLFSEIQAGNVIRELITEMQSPFSYSGSIFFIRYPIVAVISALTFLLNWKRPSPGAIGLWCAYFYLSTLSERNLSLFGLVAGFCVIVNCSEAARDKSPGRALTFAAWSTRAICGALALVAIPAVVTDFYYQKIDPSRRFGFGVAKDRFPIRAMAFIDAERLPGPILSNLVDSNFVLFDRGPKSVYVDGRLEVYGGEIIKRADDLFRTGNGFDEAVASHGIGTVLVAYGTDGNMFRTVMRKADWAPLYFDETHVVFVRLTPEISALVDALRIDWRAPVRREVVVAARLNPPDWLAETWPRVADDIAPKALGQLALLTGNLRLARERFEEALRARPDDAYAALHLVVICRALGDDACANNLAPLAGAAAAQITTPMAAAAAFEGSGSLEAAVTAYGEMIARNRATTDVYQKLAQAAFGANMLDEAEKAYRWLADRQPNAAQYWNGLGMVATRRGAYEEALNYFNRSLAIAPRQPAALTAVGVVYVKMGQPDRASESFKQALEIDSNYQPARRELGALGSR